MLELTIDRELKTYLQKSWEYTLIRITNILTLFKRKLCWNILYRGSLIIFHCYKSLTQLLWTIKDVFSRFSNSLINQIHKSDLRLTGCITIHSTIKSDISVYEKSIQTLLMKVYIKWIEIGYHYPFTIYLLPYTYIILQIFESFILRKEKPWDKGVRPLLKESSVIGTITIWH